MQSMVEGVHPPHDQKTCPPHNLDHTIPAWTPRRKPSPAPASFAAS